MSDTRGQAFTLEGVIGAMILLTAVLFALNSAVLLPSTGETGNQAQIEQEAKDIMQIAADEELLSETVRCYDTESEGWFGGTGPSTAPPDNEFGTMLEETFGDRDRSYNVEFADGETSYDDDASRIVYQGASTRDGVSVTRTVTLYNDDSLIENDGCNPSGGDDLGELDQEDTPYPISDTDDTEQIYNVVEVRLTIR
ncbi:DUF7288 family protein [Natranaeroarchaeum aerophilus]|uniref:Uncharacterized protein n=1 Tax=Natranaeroarchaeum aerophilus TaxID=2917711 RepID=A0AAE3FSC8_9EURY|nr:hypothetical protein [Natranaeroarchaeum aerophilus]MCL9814336.1 hypothetical protein [Natranaeroarchaeum aerophilus]